MAQKIKTSKPKIVREWILLKFFENLGPLHAKLYKHRAPWGISTKGLLAMPTNSLGYNIGIFLQSNHLEPIPIAERHDVFHVLLNYGTTVPEEAGMQFCIFGAGKRSASVLATMFLAIIFLPEHWKYFWAQYQSGKNYLPFYDLPFQHLLHAPAHELRANIFKRKS
jgi:ubiquinone biosynthesis protein Coq4